jgi:hypothetical protein
VQAPQVLVVAQIGAVPPQVALVTHPTHVLVEVSQTEAAAAQSVFAPHWMHVPEAEQRGWTGSFAAHWVLEVQAVHVPAAQTGAEAGHVVLSRQPTQAPAAEQRVRAGSFSEAHWALVAHRLQSPAAQRGAVEGQAALVRQATHLFVLVSQTGIAPEHEELSTHWTHLPSARQMGALWEQLAFV